MPSFSRDPKLREGRSFITLTLTLTLSSGGTVGVEALDASGADPPADRHAAGDTREQVRSKAGLRVPGSRAACFRPIWVLVRPACCVRHVSWRSLMLMLMRGAPRPFVPGVLRTPDRVVNLRPNAIL